jgi:hypothetical protein
LYFLYVRRPTDKNGSVTGSVTNTSPHTEQDNVFAEAASFKDDHEGKPCGIRWAPEFTVSGASSADATGTTMRA